MPRSKRYSQKHETRFYIISYIMQTLCFPSDLKGRALPHWILKFQCYSYGISNKQTTTFCFFIIADGCILYTYYKVDLTVLLKSIHVFGLHIRYDTHKQKLNFVPVKCKRISLAMLPHPMKGVKAFTVLHLILFISSNIAYDFSYKFQFQLKSQGIIC